MTDHPTKRLLNAPADIVTEALAGMIAAHPDLLALEGPTGRAVVAVDGPRDGKVGIVIGGGSGHEPAFAGYVGRGLADAAAVGNVFASPGPQQIMDAARAVEGGAGVLFLYGNYTGDVMNFDMAVEACAAEGIPARSLAVTDDVASAPRDRAGDRRGIAGDFFVFKIAGAAADAGRDLEECLAAARAANAATRTMGVALTPCAMPQTGQAHFTIAPDRMEIGMGIHGEPGMRSAPLGRADDLADELIETILEDLGARRNDRVAVLVNGLGATGQLELYILNRRIAQVLADRGITVHRTWVGEYCTSLDMAGASVTLMRLDDDLAALLDRPCRTVALTVGETPTPMARRRDRPARGPAPTEERKVQSRSTLATDGTVTPQVFRAMMRGAAQTISDQRDWLSQLDGVIGDGDHGITMEIGWTAITRVLDEAPADATITDLCDRMSTAFLDAVGASTGPLYASAFAAAGAAVADRLNLDGPAMAAWIRGMCDGIMSRGGAALGDKTMIDAWLPAADAASAHDADPGSALKAAANAAAGGRDRTAQMKSRRGRSAKLGARSLGHIDPGAASACLILGSMRQHLG
ncbi:dihydroxyacetone kinase subunit DhaK [Paracoccus liaowanqingii]|uniref:Dihydroxyacetone kinase subunit DhaK n=1 Tax=Paracoccus liaowanqingii TaxID=2560053 RepID=A0A4Z1BM34_9RHOB|nr:dihydroxyacetone kinase subunit DhaL [Paracoccus liaowanqingii]TGN62188.1 dihydroxyacetone kinase subunit DhaK [Paracoccus liaowanqingii]